VIDARLKLVAVIGLVLGVVALAFTLSQSPITVARVNTAQAPYLASATERTHVCQSGELLPRGVSAIRLRAFAFLGPKVTLSLSTHGHVIVHGERGSGWTGGVVTVPVNRLATAVSDVELCFTLFLNGDESIALTGEQTDSAHAASYQYGSLPGRVRVEYLRPSRSSWLSLAPEVARRMGLGHAPSGTWSVLLVIALMATVLALCARMIVRELR
jgi:hypothetical protein